MRQLGRASDVEADCQSSPESAFARDVDQGSVDVNTRDLMAELRPKLALAAGSAPDVQYSEPSTSQPCGLRQFEQLVTNGSEASVRRRK